LYKHILIPTDGTELAAKALDAGIALAAQSKAKVTFFTAVPEYVMPTEGDILAHKKIESIADFEQRSRGLAERILAGPASRARAAGIEADTDYVESDRPSQAIVAAAEAHGCDLIVMSSHGRSGLAELWHGSQTHDVLTHSSIPTLVYR
jgi:nucleotide-binding universal stress UspA family protein